MWTNTTENLEYMIALELTQSMKDLWNNYKALVHEKIIKDVHARECSIGRAKVQL